MRCQTASARLRTSSPAATSAALAAAYEDEHLPVVVAAAAGFVDEIVEPAQTRTALARAIYDAVQTDGVRRGQHGNIPL